MVEIKPLLNKKHYQMESSTTLPSIWTSINNWCTPTLVFFFLNLMIATILFTSNLPNTNNQNKQQNQKTQTQNVFDHPFPEQPQPIPVSPKPDLDPNRFDQTKKVQPQSEPPANRTKTDTQPASGEAPAKMKKSASMRSPSGEVPVEARRPGTVRERRTAAKAAVNDVDVDVNAKADDFIKKFKDHLKLQMLDAIIRHNIMVNRAAKAAKAEKAAKAAKAAEAAKAAVNDVDVDADDFIKKFNTRLKLQRLDAIIWYKEMVNRAAKAAVDDVDVDAKADIL